MDKKWYSVRDRAGKCGRCGKVYTLTSLKKRDKCLECGYSDVHANNSKPKCRLAENCTEPMCMGCDCPSFILERTREEVIGDLKASAEQMPKGIQDANDDFIKKYVGNDYR